MRLQRTLLRPFAAALFSATAFLASAFPIELKGLDTLNTTIIVRDLRVGHDLVNVNADRPLIPASITKAVTTASVLNIADPAERFATQVLAVGQLRDSVLRGNIVVKASGDPTIESRFFPEASGFADSIAASLSAMGVTRVEGRVIIDESDFPDATTPPGWMDEDLLYPYGTRLHGANFRDNRFVLRLPGGESSPSVPGITVKYLPSKGRGVKISRRDGSEVFEVRGPKRAVSESVAMPYPAKAMAREITTTLRARGIAVDEKSLSPRGDETVTLYCHLSPAIADIMRSLMFRSDNLMAEGMLRSLTPGGTRADALAEQKQIWADMALVPYNVNLVDGSGLSRNDRLTGRFMTSLLQQMSLTEMAGVYTSFFPRAGYDGTLRNFLLDTDLEGLVAMKTGSMKGVQSYAGYMIDEETGRPSHIIVFMSNNFRCSRAALKTAFQRLLISLLSPQPQEQVIIEDKTDEN